MNITVTVKGPLFDKKIDDVVQKAILDETLGKVEERLMRKGQQGSGGKGIGVRRNIVTSELNRERLTLDYESTLIRPRVRGSSWQRKNIGIVKAMTPRVIRKTADRIVSELG